MAGRVLVGIGEVIVGADLVDHSRDRDPCNAIAVATQRTPASAPPTSVGSAGTAPRTSERSARTAPPEPATNRAPVRAVRPTAAPTPAARLARTQPPAAGNEMKLESVPVRPGRWILVRKSARTLSVTNYPNAGDRQQYSSSRTKGQVPLRGGHVPGTGGSIGIHGTVDDALNQSGVNWTYGCISLLSADMRELYKTVPVGTPVVIEH